MSAGALSGFPGMALAAPVAAVVGAMARFCIERYLAGRPFPGRGAP